MAVDYNVTKILIMTRFVIDCPLHRIMGLRIAAMAQPDSTHMLDRENRT